VLSEAFLLFAAMASQLDQEPPILRASTPKSLQDFGSCFTRAQDRASHPWAFMATESGGTFTNAGATGVAEPYWLQVREARLVSHVQLFAGKTSGDLLKAVNECR
jgi:hypothetical protein